MCTFVHEDIYDVFVKSSVEETSKRTVGNPFEHNENGPQVNEFVLGLVRTVL